MGAKQVSNKKKAAQRTVAAAKKEGAKAAQADAVESGKNDIRRGVALKKTSFSNTSRLLFVAGLEGTGHHALNSMMYLCCHTRPKLCEPAREISLAMQQMNQAKNVVNGLMSGTELVSDAAYVSFIEAEMLALKRVPGEHLFFLGLGFTIGAGMMSYPNFDGRYKSMDHPDVFALADIAESVGVDFRVLVLQRSAASILASTGRRGFGGGVQSKILVDNAAALSSQLSMLDPEFFLCMSLTDVAAYSSEQNETLRDFLHPVNMHRGNVFQNMMSMIRPSAPGPSNIVEVVEEGKQEGSNSNSNSNSSTSTSSVNVKMAISSEALYQSTEAYNAFMLDARLLLIDSMCRGSGALHRQHWRDSQQPQQQQQQSQSQQQEREYISFPPGA